PASCSFNMPMICSSVKRLRFILWSSQMGQSLLQNGLFQRGKVKIDVWVGRDLGYRGGRRTGLALTDEHSLELYAFHLKVFSLERSTHGPPVKERTAASVYRVLTAVNIPILTWNVFPLHPHESGKPMSNRQHTRSEAELGFSFLEELCTSLPVRNLIAIGNDAAVWTQRLALRNLCVRHPSYGGQTIFLKQMNEIYGHRIESYGQGGAI
ncbi:uracil-DNA glycosylase, partial [Rhizobium bangladeshense]|uniref:uracil-DNA glycosylase n=1 Tax=Rhizobium bangladeshense TaxID=1138189 RepID=UPI0018D2B9F6